MLSNILEENHKENHSFFSSEEEKNIFNNILGNPEFKIRDYQYDLYEKAKNQNSIVVLETGTGKTLIAILLIHYHLNKYQLEKKVVFITNTVQLCEQQFDQIIKKMPKISKILREKGEKIQIDIEKIKYEILHGDKNVDTWTGSKWKEIITQSNVFSMTSQVFLNCLRRGYLKFTDFSLIILDECHHANKQHPYNNIMKEFYFYYKNNNESNNNIILPRILGLTASPFLTLDENVNLTNKNSNIKEIEENLILLCKNLHSNFLEYNSESLKKYLIEAKNSLCIFDNDIFIDKLGGENFLSFLESYNEKMGNFEKSFQQNQLFNRFYKDFKSIFKAAFEEKGSHSTKFKELIKEIDKYFKRKTLRILHEIGNVGLSFFINEILDGLEIIENNYSIGGTPEDIEGFNFLKKMFCAVNSRFIEWRENIFENSSPKLIRLIKLIEEKDELTPDKQMTLLIFVNKRMIAKYMNSVLDLYFSHRTGYIVGQSRDPEKKNFNKNSSLEKEVPLQLEHSQIQDIFSENIERINQNLFGTKKSVSPLKHFIHEKYTLKQQLRVIQSFKEKSIDFLISTSVTEEGFDVPNCNLVIAYNDVQTIRSFIQLKGRARKENSEFMMFAPEILKDKINIKKTNYETLSEKMKDSINAISQKSIKEIMNTEISLQIKKKDRFYECMIIESSGAFLNSNWAKDILQNYCSFLKKNDRIPNKCLEYFLKISSGITPNTFICLIIMPPNAEKQLFFYSDPLPTKEEAKKASYYQAAVELYKAGCFTKNLSPCSVDLYLINLENEEDENIEKDFHYRENMKKYVKTISNSSKSIQKFYPKINQDKVFKFCFLSHSLLFSNIQEWEFDIYSIDFTYNHDKNKQMKTKLGLLYYSNILHNFSKGIYNGKNEKIVEFRLILKHNKINLKDSFSKLFKIYQFLEIVQKSQLLNYLSILSDTANLKDKFSLKSAESSLILVLLDENYNIDFGKYEEIEQLILILLDFYKISMLSQEQGDFKEKNTKHNNKYLASSQNNLASIHLSSLNEVFLIKKVIESNEIVLNNIRDLESEKIVKNDEIIVFPLDANILKDLFYFEKNLFFLRDFLISLKFKEKMKNLERKKISFCKMSEKSLSWDYMFWQKNETLFCQFLKNKYPYILKNNNKLNNEINMNFNPIIDNSVDQRYFENNANEILEEISSSQLTSTENLIKSFNYDVSQNNSKFIEIGSSILSLLVSISCFISNSKEKNKNYPELKVQRARLITQTFLHQVYVKKKFFKYYLTKSPLPVTEKTFVNDEKEKNMISPQSINETVKEHADFIKALLGFYHDQFQNIQICQKILWELEIIENPCWKIIQTGSFQIKNDSPLYLHFGKLLERHNFKNHGLMIQAFSSCVLMKRINEFYLNDKTFENRNMSFLTSSFSVPNNTNTEIDLELSQLEIAKKIVDNLKPSNFLNEKLVFLGEAIVEYVFVAHLYEDHFDPDLNIMKIKKKVICNRLFYQFLAIYIDLHKFVLNDQLKRYGLLKLIDQNFSEYMSDYNKYLDLFFKKKQGNNESLNDMTHNEKTENIYNQENEEVVDCFLAFCGAILVDCNFIIDYAKSEILKLSYNCIKAVVYNEIISQTPWFKYEEYLKEKGLKEIGFKKKMDYKKELTYLMHYERIKENLTGYPEIKEIQARNEDEARDKIIKFIFY